MTEWLIRVLLVLGGSAVGLGFGLLIGAELMREHIGKSAREQRTKRIAQRHRFRLDEGGR